ncbi:MAG: C40 family peptidase [Phycisphaerales bacterium]|nr:C40 family peptidase [Hyphomonadaceae bacterium]
MNDARLTPARSDVAAAKLRGKVDAERFVEAVPHQVKVGASVLREAPSFHARLATQLLYGEIFDVYDQDNDGWVWGQARLDAYVGYARAESFDTELHEPTHRVAVLRTLVFPEPDKKSQPPSPLSLNAKITVSAATENGFAPLSRGGWVYAAHIALMGDAVDDWVASAERFVGLPYLWGGKDSSAVDCSGLIQTALETGGVSAPRDADMQESAVGETLPLDAALQRGDLVFWPGHVGLMRSETELLHANAFHMQTVVEPLADAITRVGPPRTIRRL